jgi:DNA-binding response OmpR family regulator
MYTRLDWKILVVEDDDDLYPGMERALHQQAKIQLITITVIRSTTLADAKQKFAAYRLDVISTDMGFPLLGGDPIHSAAGAHLVGYVAARAQTPIMVYSGNQVARTKQVLSSVDTATVPDILQKNGTVGHDPWARSTLHLLLRR